MKHNVIFAVLTAVILVSGFFATDILQYFNTSSPEESFRSISKGDSNAVYLSSEREIINPMESLSPSDDIVSKKQREIATGVVKAMARYNETTYIAWGTDIFSLEDAWQNGGDGFIYVDKWKYINYGKKSERLLDCIISTNDYSLKYIRFYSEEVHNLPAYDLNKGLEKISEQSVMFYSNLDVIMLTIEDVLYSLKADLPATESDDTAYDEYGYSNKYHYFHSNYYFEYIGEIICIDEPHYTKTYEDMRKLVEYIYPDCELHKFWLSPIDMTNKLLSVQRGYYDYYGTYHEGIQTDVVPVHYILDEFDELSAWFNPSYSSKDGRIYQNIRLNSGNLTVIYSIKEDMVEGFYFEEN